MSHWGREALLCHGGSRSLDSHKFFGNHSHQPILFLAAQTFGGGDEVGSRRSQRKRADSNRLPCPANTTWLPWYRLLAQLSGRLKGEPR